MIKRVPIRVLSLQVDGLRVGSALYCATFCPNGDVEIAGRSIKFKEFQKLSLKSQRVNGMYHRERLFERYYKQAKALSKALHDFSKLRGGIEVDA